MNSNQRSQGNNQSDNGGNELHVSSSRAGVVDTSVSSTGGTVEKDNLNDSQQSGTLGAGRQGEKQQYQGGSQQGSSTGQESTDRTGSQTGAQQQGQAAQRQSNDLAGGMPKSPGTKSLAADEKMDDDTGFSNTANNRQAEDIDEGSRQAQQSNVGRRSDGTPD